MSREDRRDSSTNGAAVVPTLRAAGVRVIAFGSHVDVARLKAARAAGCDEVLPRSAFFEGLEERLRQTATERG